MSSTIAPDVLTAATACAFNTSHCNESQDKNQDKLMQQYVDIQMDPLEFKISLLAPSIAIGLPFNVLAFFVLLRDRAPSTTRVLLLANTASDNFIILTALPFLMKYIYDLTNWLPLQFFRCGEIYFNLILNSGKFIQVRSSCLLLSVIYT